MQMRLILERKVALICKWDANVEHRKTLTFWIFFFALFFLSFCICYFLYLQSFELNKEPYIRQRKNAQFNCFSSQLWKNVLKSERHNIHMMLYADHKSRVGKISSHYLWCFKNNFNDSSYFVCSTSFDSNSRFNIKGNTKEIVFVLF